MRRRARGSGDGGALSMAGWLFAELALVLMVIAIGSETTSPALTATTTPTTTVPVDPSKTSEQGLRLDTVTFLIPLPDNGSGVVDRFRAELARVVAPNQRVGLALLFGVAEGGRSGTQVSSRLRDLVAAAALPQMPTADRIRPYLGDEGGPGAVKVELFLLTS